MKWSTSSKKKKKLKLLNELRMRAVPPWDGERCPPCARSPERSSHFPSASGTAGCRRFRADLPLTPGCRSQTWLSLEEWAANGDHVKGQYCQLYGELSRVSWLCQSGSRDRAIPTHHVTVLQVVSLFAQNALINNYIIYGQTANIYFLLLFFTRKT